MKSLKGHFLVASPHLEDPNFLHAVILLVQHTEEGALGVVLNRPATSTIKELWEKVGQQPCRTDQRVHVGGPVPGPLMAVHSDQSLAGPDQEIVPGVYFAVDPDELQRLVDGPDGPFRVFVGHSGWGGGQLEGEWEQGAWLTMPASVEFVFCDELDLWKRMTNRIGQAMLTSALKIKHVPDDPSFN
jgi:putative transcriptional regulator